MKPSEVVTNFFKAIEDNDFDSAKKYAADNFAVEGVTPTPIGIKEFFGVHKALNTGLPDFKFNLKTVRETGDTVEIKVHLTGTHKRDMDPPIQGLDKIKATNKKVDMPDETGILTVKNDKITKMLLKQVPGGGLPGLLSQIGVDIHAATH